ncbi:chromo domain-containing protein [Apiospora aurea]|uniref:Chromo domain-containing protein n=1 Tax=Apiospora aurea TaxID=335848 RepID=A0ABR1Q699_9PEZI
MAALQHGGPSSLFMNQNDQRDDDDISLTSTVAEANDDDKLWTVDCVLYEREMEGPVHEGEMEYLIKWEGYPLKDCTWEPVENLSEGLLEQWKDQKDEISRGERPPFDLNEYETAITDAIEAHNARHLRRNAKRRRLGQQLTAPFAEDSVDGSSASIFSRDSSVSSDEAMELDDIEPGHAEKVAVPKPMKQRVFKGIPNSTIAAGNSSKSSTRRQPIGSLADPVRQASGGSSQMVGYQGTARRTSIGDKDPTQSGAARKPSVGNKDSAQPGTSRKPSMIDKTQAKPRQPMAKTTNVAPSSSILAKKFQAVRTARPVPIPPADKLPKIRKRRSSLKESMMDSTKEPKLFNSHRRRNVARKRGQELNDSAPLNASAIPANFFITNDKPKQPAAAAVTADQLPSKTTVDDLQTGDKIQSPTAPPSVTKKPRKSVRFTEDPIFDEPAEIESPLTAPESAIPVSDTTKAPKKKLSLAAYQERSGKQAVAKTTSFGPEGSRCVRILLNGITRARLPWLKSFMDDTTLQFRMVCVAEDFLNTPEPFYETHNKLASGTVVCPEPEHMPALEVVGNNLRRTQSAFYLARQEYSILIYPSQCDAWSSLSDAASPSPTSLNHVIFQPTEPIDLGLYRPLVSSDEYHDGPGSADADVCLKVMNELIDVDPEALRSKPDYYLIHHESERFLFQMVALWLRSLVPECRIFTTSWEGSWTKFTQEGHKDGTVIIHDPVMKSIRKIPRLWDSLSHGGYNLWRLDLSGRESALSVGGVQGMLEKSPSMSLPCLKLTPLFPYGCAILITPSFAVSEPAELCRLLAWFKEKSKVAPYVLVGCANFPDYLRGLVLDKAREADQLKRTQSSDVFLDKDLAAKGLSRDDLKDRIHAWEFVCDLVSVGELKEFSLEEAPEDICKTVWASEHIDPNDEQSLVNWFAWWSTTRLTRYRKFHVIGSRARGIAKARRTVQIPNYAPQTVGDPDVAFARFLCAQQELSSDTASASGESMTPYVFPSTMFRNDQAAELKSWISHINSYQKASWVKLYMDPVSWIDVRMADAFEDPRCEYATFTNWFCSIPKFWKSVNTLMGLFYTIDTDWTGEANAASTGRHPWIAIYRPVNPHYFDKPYKEMELFLWDCGFPERSRGSSSSGPPLVPMQRRLIEFIREETSKRFPEHFLGRVWLGDFPLPETPDPPHPIDVTCHAIDHLVKHTYDLLPPFDAKLSERGWIRVREDVYNPWIGSADSRKQEADQFPKAVGDMDQPERMIIHAPQGNKQGPSRCRNPLYDEALQARRVNPRAANLDYQYQPTLEWYHALKEEGRSYNYISVDSWDKALDDLMGRP